MAFRTVTGLTDAQLAYTRFTSRTRN